MRQRQMSQGPYRAVHHAVLRVAGWVWSDFRVNDLHRSGKEFELMERAMGFAALAMLTVFPLLVVIAAASAVTHSGVARGVGYGKGLNTTSVFSLLLLGVFGVMFGGSVQAGFERIWGLPAGPWHKIWRQAVWLAGLIGYLYADATVGTGTPHAAAGETAARGAVAVVLGVAFFWWGLRFLVGGRVSYLAALPGAAATLAGLAGLRVFSGLVFQPLIVSNAV